MARFYPFIRTLAATAADNGAVVVTGGTDAGVIRLLGLSLQSLPEPPRLIGVAPAGLIASDGQASALDGADAEPVAGAGQADSSERVQPDPNHDALLLVPGAHWGDETPVLSRLVKEISDGQPAVLVVVGGGAGALVEVVEHARQKRPIVVLGRSGRLADDLANLRLEAGGAASAPISIREVHVVDLSESPSRLRALLALLLSQSRSPGLRRRFPVLSVWPRLRRPKVTSPLPFGLDAGQVYPELHDAIVEGYREVYPFFAECDQTALAEQQRYRRFVVVAIFGGLLTTFFAAIQAGLPAEWWPGVAVATLGASTTAVTTVARRQGALDSYLLARIRGAAALTLCPLRRQHAGRRRRGPPRSAPCPTRGRRSDPLRAGEGMSEPRQEEFLLAYRSHRVDDQMAFYARRARENERARREALWISAVCLVLAALFGALATADEARRQMWAVLAAGFGALATAVGAFEAAFGFERLSRQYEDTRGALHIADVDGPQTTADGGAVDSKDLFEFVERVEDILRSEVDTWSQVTAMSGREGTAPADDAQRSPLAPPKAGT